MPDEPQGRLNLTDLDSHPQKTPRGFIQGYNAQTVATKDQIVVAADVICRSSDGDQLEPMLDAAISELADAGIDERPQVGLADAGYWNSPQIHQLEQAGMTVLVPPDGNRARGPNPNRRSKHADQMRQTLDSEQGRALYRLRQQAIEPVFGQIKHNRQTSRFRRRGQAACRSEWRLITATHNLLKLFTATPTPT